MLPAAIRVFFQYLVDEEIIDASPIEVNKAPFGIAGNSVCFGKIEHRGVVDLYGRLDIMVNNAGINAGDPCERVTVNDYPINTWQRIIDVDLNGAFYCCKAAAAHMVKQQKGSIINIASVAGVVALRLQIAYVTAKAGVFKMTEVMACERDLTVFESMRYHPVRS